MKKNFLQKLKKEEQEIIKILEKTKKGKKRDELLKEKKILTFSIKINSLALKAERCINCHSYTCYDRTGYCIA